MEFLEAKYRQSGLQPIGPLSEFPADFFTQVSITIG
jgi:hypothetical protein